MKLNKLLAFVLATIMVISCMCITASADDTLQLTVNDGTDTNDRLPYYGYYGDDAGTVTQFIQPATSLQSLKGSNITKLTFYVESKTGDPNCTYQVRLMETDKSVFSTALLDITSATLVYTGKADPNESNLVVITLDTPYLYKGGNLLLDFRISATGNYKRVNFYGVNQSDTYGMYKTTDTSAAVIKFLPKMTFDYTSTNSSNLDLESSSNSGKTLEQKYSFTQVEATEYTDATMVKLEWAISDIAATYKSHQTWDYKNLTWVEAKENISVADQTATFKLTNYSSKDIVANVSFKVEEALNATYDATNSSIANNDCTVKTPVLHDTTTTYTNEDFVAKQETITATLKFTSSAFATLDAKKDSTKYGTYTVTISKAPSLISFSELTYNAHDISVTQSNIILNGSTWAEVIENNKDNTITIQLGTETHTLQLTTLTDPNGDFYVIISGVSGDPAKLVLFAQDSSTAITVSDALHDTDAVTDTLFFGAFS